MVTWLPKWPSGPAVWAQLPHSSAINAGWALTTWTSPLAGLSGCACLVIPSGRCLQADRKHGQWHGNLPDGRAVKHCTAMPADGPGVGNALCGFFAGAPSK